MRFACDLKSLSNGDFSLRLNRGSFKTVPWNWRPPRRGSIEASKRFYRTPIRNTLSTVGKSMTSSGRPSPEPILKKEASPSVLRGREREKLWRRQMHQVTGFGSSRLCSWGESRKKSESVSGAFQEFSGISSGKSQPYWVWSTYKGSIEPQKVLSNPVWPPNRFYRAPKKGSSEPQTGFHGTFRIEPPFLVPQKGV